ncbi:hypothetical protein, partial [Burkholderia sp. MSMB1835]|uniref:hypothetical protein n=1 Tax=Burkholderia sp. MSMB1835 TaxID=1637876 RepID=UPI0027B89FB2
MRIRPHRGHGAHRHLARIVSCLSCAKTARLTRGAHLRRKRTVPSPRSGALDRERDAHPAADAQRRQPALRIALD